MSAADLSETAARFQREGSAWQDWAPDRDRGIPPQQPRRPCPPTTLAVTATANPTPIPRQADTDATLIKGREEGAR